MRCSRQSGQGGSLTTYSKNQAPRMVAVASTKTANAAAAAGSAQSRLIQPCFIVLSPRLQAGSNVPILRAEARPCKAGPAMDENGGRGYREKLQNYRTRPVWRNW